MPSLPAGLRDQLLSDPDDIEAYLVCADWLQARADPRGELIVLQHAQQSRPDDPRLRAAQSELIRANARHLLGSAADHLRCFCFDWHMGFLRSLRMFSAGSDVLGDQSNSTLGERTPAEAVLGTLLRHPSASLLRSLTVGPFAWGDETRGSAQDFVDALAAGPLPQPLRELFLFDDIDDTIDEPCEVAELCEAVAQLQRLTLHGSQVLLGEPQLPCLQRLSLRGGPDQEENLRSVLRSELPALQELAIWFDPPLPGIDIEHPLLGALLEGHFAQLHTLRLRNFRSASAFCSALAGRPLADRLRRLELSMTELSARSVDTLRAAVGERLELLDLCGVRLDEEAARRLEQFPRGAVRLARVDVLGSNPYVRYGRGVSYVGLRARELSHPDAARAADAREILQRSAGAGRVLYDAGTRLVLDDRLAEGLPMLRVALEMPDSSYHRSTFSNLGVTNERLGHLDVAEEVGRRAVAVFGSDPNHWAILIDALHRQGKLEEALEALAEGESFIDGSINGMALLETCMMTWLVARCPEKARKLYEEYLDAGHTPRKESHAHAALAYAHCEDSDAANALLGKLANLDMPVVHHARACVQALSGGYQQAAASAAKARSPTYPGMALLDDDPILGMALARA